MAVPFVENYNGDGSNRIFTVINTILSESHVRVDYYYDDGSGFDDHPISANNWDIINNSVVFKEAPEVGYIVKISVSSDGQGLDTAPSDITNIGNVLGDIILVSDNLSTILTVSGMGVEIQSIATDKATLDSLYADKGTLDSLYADKVTLDSIFTDKATLDSLFTDKAVLDSLYADKGTLDSIYADKIKLDSLYTDKAKLDSLYNDKITLDSLYADKTTLDSIFTDKATLDSLLADKATLDSLYADKTKLDSLYNDKTTLDSIFDNKPNIDTVATNILDVNNYADTYHGGLAVAPTIGSHPVLSVGDMYYDTVLDELRVYDNGDVWKSAGSTVNGTAKRESFEAGTASGAYDGISLTVYPVSGGYDAGYADVYLNGAKLLNGTDVIVTSGTNAVLASAAISGDIIDVVAYGAFVLADHYTKAAQDIIDGLQDTAIATKAPLDSPALTGTPTAPTATLGDISQSIATTAFVNANSVPSGLISMWSGLISAIPATWFLCNGSNGTPDLRGRFIYGASVDGDVNVTGGRANAIVVSHTHTADHSHTGSTNSTGSHTHGINKANYQNANTNPGRVSNAASSYASTSTTAIVAAGAHSHTVTVNSASVTTSSTGSSGTNANLPPYMKLAYIMKG